MEPPPKRDWMDSMSESMLSPAFSFSCLLGFIFFFGLIENLFFYRIDSTKQFFYLEHYIIEAGLKQYVFLEVSVF